MSGDQAVVDKKVCFRLEKEIERLNIKQLEIADFLGVTTKTVSRWQKSIPIPSDKLAKLSEKDVDVIYVLTGVRSKDVTEWITFVGGNYRHLPSWARTAGYDPDTGTVYVPATMADVFAPPGNEGAIEANVALAAEFDETPSLIHMDHLFVPADWLIEEFPMCRSVCEALVKSVEAYIEEMEVDAALFEQQEDQGEERAGISSEERALLENYRSLSEEDRRAIRRQSDVFAEFNRMKQQQQDKKAG